MKSLISRLQSEFSRLQKTLQKEGNDLLKKVRKMDFKDNLGIKKKEIEKLIDSKLKGLEPIYKGFAKELKVKAGIDLIKLEKEIKKKAESARKQWAKKTGSLSLKRRSTGRKPVTVKKAKTRTTTARKKTSRKTSSSSAE